MTVQEVNPADEAAADGDEQAMQVDEGTTGSRTKRILKYAD